MNRKESIETVHRLFGWLERRYGGNLPLDTKAKVVVRDHLCYSDLKQLMTHEILALRIVEFYDKTTASILGSELASQGAKAATNWKIGTSRGLELSDVSTLGYHLPYNTIFSNNSKSSSKQKEEDYFRGVREEFSIRRRRLRDEDTTADDSSTFLWPVDQFRLELDEVWKGGGAGLARDTKTSRCMGAGLTRIMDGSSLRWKKGFIHVDEMAPLNPNKGLFSANIYLQTPSSSPLLDIWPLNIQSRWDWYRNAVLLSGLSSQDAEAQARLRHVLGEPHRIEAGPGDLILLCVQRPHAAVGFFDNDENDDPSSKLRVSLQSFVQFNGLNKRLLIEA